jgi:hypothetical protein
MNLLLPTLAALTLTSASALVAPLRANSVELASGRAEDVCVDAARDRDFDVVGVRSSSEYSGGEEVILRVEDRDGTFTLGCDYSTATGDVELYRIEDAEDDSDYRDDRRGDRDYSDRDYDDDQDYGSEDWRDRYSRSGGVRGSDEAEDIARQTVGDQLDVDPYSEIVEIDDVQEDGDLWTVEGAVNGAPFLVEIRDRDGYVTDFELR